MKMTLHLLVKDLRATRPWWVVVLVLAASQVLIPARGNISEVWSWNNLSFWLGWLLCLAVLLMQSRLLSLDPPAGAERFIGTRPVSGWRVVAGKAGVLALLGLLPLMLAFGLRIIRLGMDAGVLRTAGILAQDGCLLVLVIGMLCLPHAMPQSVWTGLAAMLAALLLFLFGNGLMFMPFAMDALPAITVLGAAAAGVMGSMLARYGRLSGWSRFGSMALAALLGGGMSYASFGPQIRPEEAAVTPRGDMTLSMNRPQQLIENASAVLSNLALRLNLDRGDVSTLERLGGREVEFRQHLRLRGLPAGVYADFESAGGFFQVAGKGEWREMRRSRTPLDWAVHPDAAFHAVPGNPVPDREALLMGQTFFLPLGQAALPELRRGEVLPVALKGDAVFTLYRARLEKVLRIEDGMTWSGDGLRIALSKLQRTAGQVQFMVEVDTFGANPHDARHSLHQGLLGYGFFGLQSGAGTPARLNAIRGWTENHPLLRHQRFTEQISISARDRWWGFPEVKASPGTTSPQETDLAILRREVIGTVRVPFEFLGTEISAK